ncbi:MAG: UDP-N-acetylglucosamine 2-epimerase (non-hydrolyzing) [Flavobacteriales bacterium]|nr:UDP-N-acetylglucosamine 2-epimerase (non-hydrolyzing) [Flavobacteriales bacterium]
MAQIFTIIGARPQFIKAAAMTRAIADSSFWSQTILHTGQHYDPLLSDIFFEELNIPKPKFSIKLNTSNRSERMVEMREGIMDALETSSPDVVLVYGDTDSTLAGAQAANDLDIPLIHIEAGLRSFDLDMPEEINRIETDKLSTLLVAPTLTAIANLESEGLFNSLLSGDIMHDNAIHFTKDLNCVKTSSVLVTMHRPSNVDSTERLRSWVDSISDFCLDNRISAIFPVHPRTEKGLIEIFGKDFKSTLINKSIKAIKPVGYIELLKLLKSSSLVITDSGGVQKEAYSCGTPSVVIRHNTEWVELVDSGHSILCPEPSDLMELATSRHSQMIDTSDNLYGDGNASVHILKEISKRFSRL